MNTFNEPRDNSLDLILEATKNENLWATFYEIVTVYDMMDSEIAEWRSPGQRICWNRLCYWSRNVQKLSCDGHGYRWSDDSILLPNCFIESTIIILLEGYNSLHHIAQRICAPCFILPEQFIPLPE